MKKVMSLLLGVSRNTFPWENVGFIGRFGRRLSGNAVAVFRGTSRTHGKPAGLSFPLYVSCHG